jgi:murein DD-endopeptidase MepM/ murein hydrolase activator NlpD
MLQGKPLESLPAGRDEEAQNIDPNMIGAFSPLNANLEAMTARGFFATGLTPVYPPGLDCGKITSTFADPYRSDGTRRTQRYFMGLHGGIDIPMPAGTPILALASGTVVHRTDKEIGIGGIGLVLQHAPEDTGLPVWTYTKYEHLREPTTLAIGQRVSMGDIVGYTGISGTTGHYGEEGLSHLHLAVYMSEYPEYKGKRLFVPRDGRWIDPLALLRARMPIDSEAMRNLPDGEKKVAFPYRTANGQLVPKGTKIIWPFICKKPTERR